MASDQGEARQTQESLLVRLTPDELVRKAEHLARHLQETAALKQSQRRAQKLATEQIKEREETEAELAQEIASGTETREVLCFERPRHDALLVDVVRSDTGEVIRSRAMQPHERQQPLAWGDDDDREDPNPRAN